MVMKPHLRVWLSVVIADYSQIMPSLGENFKKHRLIFVANYWHVKFSLFEVDETCKKEPKIPATAYRKISL